MNEGAVGHRLALCERGEHRLRRAGKFEVQLVGEVYLVGVARANVLLNRRDALGIACLIDAKPQISHLKNPARLSARRIAAFRKFTLKLARAMVEDNNFGIYTKPGERRRQTHFRAADKRL